MAPIIKMLVKIRLSLERNLWNKFVVLTQIPVLSFRLYLGQVTGHQYMARPVEAGRNFALVSQISLQSKFFIFTNIWFVLFAYHLTVPVDRASPGHWGATEKGVVRGKTSTGRK